MSKSLSYIYVFDSAWDLYKKLRERQLYDAIDDTLDRQLGTIRPKPVITEQNQGYLRI